MQTYDPPMVDPLLPSLDRADPDPLLQQCQAAQACHQLFSATVERPLTVVVAVSGGADSVALLHVLQRLAPVWHLTLHVVHVNHNLRPESGDDAHFVAQLAERWQVPFHGERLAPSALTTSSEGIEAAGRRARYRFFTEVALTVAPPTQIPIIALAHHADDQAETLLLHLVRGSGLRGLGGMRWVSSRRVGDLWPDAPINRQEQQLQLVRPFLGVQRVALLRYLRTAGLTWREDSTNADPRFVRNRLRHTVLPTLLAINPNVVHTLVRTAEILQQEADRLVTIDRARLVAVLTDPTCSLAEVQAWYGQSRAEQISTAPARLVLALPLLATLSIAEQRGVLREALVLVTKQALTPDFAQVESLLTALQPPVMASGPHPLFADVAWSVAGATMTIPARLSLHQQNALPFAPDHPFLDEQWRKHVGSLPLPAEGAVAIDDGWILQVTRSTLPKDWRSRLHPWQVYLDADQAGQPVLTTPRPGHVFTPLGMGGQHQTLGDFFTNRKVPVTLRSGWPIIVDQSSGEILWVGGYQPNHHARITEGTRWVLGLKWKRDDKVNLQP